MSSYSIQAVTALLQKIEQLKVLVIGDLMIDAYLYGTVHRISPEAPVPIVQIESKENRLGGAANVALNCKALVAKVTLAGLVGEDEAAKEMRKLLSICDIAAPLLMTDVDRPTTIKTRVLSRQQQLFRMDEEHFSMMPLNIEHQFIDGLLKHIQIEKPDVVIFEDYDKGCLNPHIIQKVSEHAKRVGSLVTVDPKFNNFHAYKGVDIFKPNLKEVCDAYKLVYNRYPMEVLSTAATKIKEELAANLILITLSEQGVFVQEGEESTIIPGRKRNIADVSGAGDTVIAVASLVYAVTKDSKLTAQLANVAGGMVCEYAGVVPIDKTLWQQEIESFFENK